MRSHSVFVVTRADATSVAALVADYFARVRASVDRIVDDRTAQERANGSVDPTLAIVGVRDGLFRRWGVQVYVYRGDGRTGIDLVAIGAGAMGQLRPGRHSAVSFRQSAACRDALVAALVARDPAADVRRE